MTLETVIFLMVVAGQVYLSARWFEDPYEAVARDTMRALASPSLAMLRLAAGFGIHGTAIFAAGWFARLPWLWWVYGLAGIAGGLFMASLSVAMLFPRIRQSLENRPGWEEARSRPLTGDDVREIPKLRERAENRRGHAPFSAALLGLWVWAWWPVLPLLGG